MWCEGKWQDLLGILLGEIPGCTDPWERTDYHHQTCTQVRIPINILDEQIQYRPSTKQPESRRSVRILPSKNDTGFLFVEFSFHVNHLWAIYLSYELYTIYYELYTRTHTPIHTNPSPTHVHKHNSDTYTHVVHCLYLYRISSN